MKPTSATMKPTFTTTTRDTATTTTHPPPPCKQTHKKSKKNPFKCWYYLTSKHQKGPLPDLLLVKKFTIVLLYCSSIVKIKIIHFILSFSFPWLTSLSISRPRPSLSLSLSLSLFAWSGGLVLVESSSVGWRWWCGLLSLSMDLCLVYYLGRYVVLAWWA